MTETKVEYDSDGQWVGNHYIAYGGKEAWACANCKQQKAFSLNFRAFACEPVYKSEKPAAPKHQVRYDSQSARVECTYCGAQATTEYLLDMVACDPLEETRVHTGPAAWLCDTGAGHVCAEPESRFEQLLAQMKELHDKKKADYTGTSGDLIWNYRSSAKLAGITTAQGMFARLCEKVIRISSVLSNGGATQVTDETITDTYFDLAVISLLSIIEAEERR